MFLPWVFTGSGVSTTPQRLCPAAPWTETAQGQQKGQHQIYMQPGHSEDNNEARAMAISPRPPKGGQGRLRSQWRP